MKNHYINNKEFYNQIVEYRNTKGRKVYEELGKKFLLISRQFLNKPYFINYSDDRKDEMVSDSVFCMVKYLHNYDTTKTNPLAYFTQVAFNCNLQYIKKQKRRQETTVSLDLTENLDYANSTNQMMGD